MDGGKVEVSALSMFILSNQYSCEAMFFCALQIWHQVIK